MKQFWLMACAMGMTSACVSVEGPTLVDRHTVMEQEAAGEWPKLEQEFYDKAVRSGPVPLPRDADSKRKQRVYRILNGDLVGNK